MNPTKCYAGSLRKFLAKLPPKTPVLLYGYDASGNYNLIPIYRRDVHYEQIDETDSAPNAVIIYPKAIHPEAK